MEKLIGNIYITLADGIRKFEVTCSAYNKAGDALGRVPAKYTFVDIKRPSGTSQLTFVAEVSSGVVSGGIPESISEEKHIDIVRAAYFRLSAEKPPEVFLIVSEVINALQQNRRSGDPTLETELLDKFVQINSIWPNETVDVWDLMFMFNADKDELRGWLDTLVAGEFLISERTKKEDRLRNVTHVGNPAWKLNPRNRKETIERHKELSDGSKVLKVFLSYSTKDKILAGKVKAKLEEIGKEGQLTVFLAHEDIKVSQKWRNVILQELEACQIFIPLFTKKFKTSAWTGQEAGIAFAKKKKIIPLKCPNDPIGFMDIYQAKRLDPEQIDSTCQEVYDEIVDYLTARQ